MKTGIRLAIVLFAVIFAAGTVAHALSTTVMSVEMAKMSHGTGHPHGGDDAPADCSSCASSEDVAHVCSLDCSPPMSAVFALRLGVAVPRPSRDVPPMVDASPGYNVPIEPEPPRILS